MEDFDRKSTMEEDVVLSDPDEGGRHQVSDPTHWFSHVRRAFDDFLLRYEAVLGQAVPLGQRREAVMRPFTRELEELKKSIAELSQLELVNHGVYELLKECQLTEAHKLKTVLTNTSKSDALLEHLQQFLNTQSFEDIILEVIKRDSMLSETANILGSSYQTLPEQVQILKEQNDALKMENEQLRKSMESGKDNSLSFQNMTFLTAAEEEALLNERMDTASPSKYSSLSESLKRVMARSNTPLQGLHLNATTFTPREARNSPAQPGQDTRKRTGELRFHTVQGEQLNSTIESEKGAHEGLLTALVKSQALPNLEGFSGERGESFEAFMMLFNMKYCTEGFPEIVRKALFTNLLKGRARKIFNSLTVDMKNGNLRNIMARIAERLKGDTRMECIQAMNRLQNLKLSNGKLEEFCTELEELSSAAYKGMASTEINFLRAKMLYENIADWPGAVEALQMLKSYNKEVVYESVKNLACNIAYNSKLARSVASRKIPDRQESKYEYNQALQNNRKNSDQIACYSCGRLGHLKKDCKAPKKDALAALALNRRKTVSTHRTNTTISSEMTQSAIKGEKETMDPVSFLGLSVIGRLNSVSSMSLYGNRPVGTVSCLGGTYEALIDSGAQPSVMSVEVWREAHRNGINLREHVEIIQENTENQIMDASGNTMKVKAIFAMNVKLHNNGRIARVLFHLLDGEAKDKGNEIILGTNAFPDLGIKLAFEAKNTTERVQVVQARPDSVSTGIHEVEAACRMELKPNETRWIPLKVDPQLAGQEGIFNPATDEKGRKYGESGLVRVDKEGLTHVLLNNPSEARIIIRKAQKVGSIKIPKEVFRVKAITEVVRLLKEVHKGQKLRSPTREKDLLNLLFTEVSETPTKELVDIIREYQDVFAIEEAELKQTHLAAHDIDTGGTAPVRQKCRPIPAGVRNEFRQLLNGLLERGVIVPSQSPWASPVVLVVKKDGTLRLCIDFREVNKRIKLDAYPIPSIDSILRMLKGKKYFTTLDMHAGFWQLPLTKEASEKTAFTTTEGLFEFKVLPFGLATSPAAFQRLMDKVLKEFHTPENEVLAYIDDILICTETKERHLVVLKKVLQTIREANLAVKAQKCRFMQESVPYLGHVVNQDGISTDPAKVEAIRAYLKPQNLADLRTFLGMAGYYRKFILNFAAIAKPLFELTKTETKFEWTAERNEAFITLKDRLCTAPILMQPDIDGALSGENPFIIYTDASARGIGSVLSQKGKDNFLHPVWFSSKSLTKAESNYHVTDLEALAVVHALNKFSFLIYNTKGTVVKTDHQPLLCLFKKNISARMLRWSLLIQHHNVTIEYVKGAANIVADALSRGLTPHEDLDNAVVCDDLSARAVNAMVKSNESEWLKELLNQPPYGEIIIRLKANDTSATLDLREGGRRLSLKDFCVEDGYLWLLLDGQPPRKVVPDSKRREIFDSCHSGKFAGHFGPKKIFRSLKQHAFWESMARDVYVWHKECVKCFLDNANQRLVPPLKPIVTSRPYELVGLDIMDLGPTTSGNRYVLVLVDHFSKWVGAYPIPNKTARCVAETIVTKWIGEGGRWPKCFHSDQGTEFLNETLEELRKSMNIELSLTKGYNPRENGITERVNRTLQKCLRKRLSNPAEWDQVLPFVLYAYNTTAHESTGESPFFLLHGFDPVCPAGLSEPSSVSPYVVDPNEYRSALVEAVKISRDLALVRNNKERERFKLNYDKRHKVESKVFPRVGDRVFLKIPGEKAKSKNPKLIFELAGPYRVLEVSENSALITEIYKNKEPMRAQFYLLLKIPIQLDMPELVSRKKRKIRRQELPTRTLANIFVSNSIICSGKFWEVLPTHPLHPTWMCQGKRSMGTTIETTEENCTMTQASCLDLCTIFRRVCPIGCENRAVKSVMEAARILCITDDTSILPRWKPALIQDGYWPQLTTDSLARAYKFVKDRCLHVDVAFTEFKKKRFVFAPALPGMQQAQIEEAFAKVESIGHKLPGGSDLLLFPDNPAYTMTNSLLLKFGTCARYDGRLEDAAIAMHDTDSHYRYVVVIADEAQEEKAVERGLEDLQYAAKRQKAAVIVVAPPVLHEVETWKGGMETLQFTAQTCYREWEKKNVAARVQVAVPNFQRQLALEEHLARPWMVLGTKVVEHSEGRVLSKWQLAAYVAAVHQELKQDGILTSLATAHFTSPETHRTKEAGAVKRTGKREDARPGMSHKKFKATPEHPQMSRGEHPPHPQRPRSKHPPPRGSGDRGRSRFRWRGM